MYFGKICVAATLLAAPVYGQDTSGDVSLGLQWSSEYGSLGTIGLNVDNVFGRNLDVKAEYERGEAGSSGTVAAQYYRHVQLGTVDATSVMRLEGSSSRWEKSSFQSDQAYLSFGFQGTTVSNLDWSAALFGQYDNILNMNSAGSPLLQEVVGESTSAGLTLSLGVDNLNAGPLPGSGYAVNSQVTWAGFGDRRFVSTSVQAAAAVSLSENSVFMLTGEAGKISGLSGQNVNMIDRAFLNSSALRGFAQGSSGPKDYVSGGINTALGGENYATFSLEARHRVTDRFTVGVFADAGSAWGLEGDLVGASGPIDDSQFWRSSVGLAGYVETSFGVIGLSIAEPTRLRPGDTFNKINIGLISNF